MSVKMQKATNARKNIEQYTRAVHSLPTSGKKATVSWYLNLLYQVLYRFISGVKTDVGSFSIFELSLFAVGIKPS